MATVHEDAKVGPCDVREIIDTDLTDERIANFINMAYLATLPLDGELGSCGGELAHKYIQQLLAAHFLTLYERTVKSESVGGEWSVTYAFADGPGLRASMFGQQAIALDCTGTLAKGGEGLRPASFSVTSYRQLGQRSNLFDGDLL